MPDMEMPSYKCHKIVHALKILRVEHRTLIFEDDRYDSKEMSQGWITDRLGPRIGHSVAVAGSYYVMYEDGYESWSPAEAFEAGYTRINQAVAGEEKES